MADLRKPLLEFFVFIFASLDFALLGWQIPWVGGMALDVWRLVFCLIGGAVAVWAVFRVFQAKSRSTTLTWIGFVMLASLAIHPALESAQVAARQSRCFQNLEALGLASIHYASDNDDRLPPLDRWRNLTEPYTGLSPVAGVSSAPDPALRCPDAKQAWAYGLNSSLSGLNFLKVGSPDSTAMIFDTESANPNASGGLKDLAERHGGRAGITFTDGHVQFRKGTDVRWIP